MSRAKLNKSTTVARCVVRQDGGWLVLTRDGQSAVSPHELPEGARVMVRDGKAERQSL